MPELPECEANRRRVAEHCLNRTIESVELGEVEHMDMPGANERGRLTGRQFTETRRHGKYIFAGSKSGPWIAVHLGMTGSLRPFDAPDDPPDYAKLVIAFEGDRRLAFRCPRKLGWVRVIDDPDAFLTEQDLGPDALEIGLEAFVDVIGSTNGAVKSALMSQKKLAGIGNLWSDEALFQQGIAPTRVARELDRDALADLHRATRRILQTVCDTGARYGDLPRGWLIPDHRDEGAACPRCDGTITKTKVGGRTAYFCDTHQG